MEHNQSGDPKPMMLAGAGPLIASIWKLGNEHSGWRYRFDIRRKLAERGCHSDLFQPSDLGHFVRLTQVLAALITDDGCLTQEDRTTLNALAAELDTFLGGPSAEADPEATEIRTQDCSRHE